MPFGPGPAEKFLQRHIHALGIAICLAGLIWRLYYSWNFYLNPDEALYHTVVTYRGHGLVQLYRHARSILHPPLFVAVLRFVTFFGHSERLLRIVPVFAGALFPLVVMEWVRRFAPAAAALCAQLVLTFSPDLVDLSSEVRAYTMAFLFLALYLLLNEIWLDRSRTLMLAAAQGALYLAVLSEYTVAFFVAAIGVYTAWCLWKKGAQPSTWATWIGGQSLALGLYFFLYVTHIRPWSPSDLTDMYSTWLAQGFPAQHDNLLAFAGRSTFAQFLYLFDTRRLAWAGIAACLLGLFLLWKNGAGRYALLLVLPAIGALLGAIFHLFPFGATRHSAVVGIAIATAAAIGMAAAVGNRALLVLLAGVPVAYLWNTGSPGDYLTLRPERRQVSAMRQAIDFLRNVVPPGSTVMTDSETYLELEYYLACPPHSSAHPYAVHDCGGQHIVVAPLYHLADANDVGTALSGVRDRYHPDRPVWVMSGGFALDIGTPESRARPFGKTMAIFQAD